MSNLNINTSEVLKDLTRIETTTKELKENYERFYSKLINLGQSWRDQEYAKAKGYNDKAKSIIDIYVKETTEYIEQVKIKIDLLDKEYSQNGGEGSGLGELSLGLDGLDLSDIDTEIPEELLNEVKKVEDKYKEIPEEIDEDIIRLALDFIEEQEEEIVDTVGDMNYDIVPEEIEIIDTVGDLQYDIVDEDEIVEIEGVVNADLLYALKDLYVEKFVKDGKCVIPEGVEIIFPLNIDDNFERELENIEIEYMPGIFAKKEIVELELPSTMKIIGIGAFDSNNIEILKLPEGIEEIREFGFTNNKIEKLIIPEGVKYIGECAFDMNKIEEVVLPSTLKHVGVRAFGDVKKIFIQENYPYTECIEDRAYLDKVVIVEEI